MRGKKKRNKKQFCPVKCGGVEPTGLDNKKCLFLGRENSRKMGSEGLSTKMSRRAPALPRAETAEESGEPRGGKKKGERKKERKGVAPKSRVFRLTESAQNRLLQLLDGNGGN